MFNLLKSIFIALFFCFSAFTLWASDEATGEINEAALCSDAVSPLDNKKKQANTENSNDDLLLQYNPEINLSLVKSSSLEEPFQELRFILNGNEDLSELLSSGGENLSFTSLYLHASAVSNFFLEHNLPNWHTLLAHGFKDFFRILDPADAEIRRLAYFILNKEGRSSADSLLSIQNREKFDAAVLSLNNIFEVTNGYKSEFSVGFRELYKTFYQVEQVPISGVISREDLELKLKDSHLGNHLPARHKIKPKYDSLYSINIESLEFYIHSIHSLLDELRFNNIIVSLQFKQKIAHQLVSLVSVYYVRNNIEHYIVYDELTEELYIEINPAPEDIDPGNLKYSDLNVRAREMLDFSVANLSPKLIYSPMDFIDVKNRTFFDSRGNEGSYSIYSGYDRSYNYFIKLSHVDSMNLYNEASYAFQKSYYELVVNRLAISRPDEVFENIKISDLPFFGYSVVSSNSKVFALSSGEFMHKTTMPGIDKPDPNFKVFRHDESYRNILVLENIMNDFISDLADNENYELDSSKNNEDKLRKLINDFEFYLYLAQKSVERLETLSNFLNSVDFTAFANTDKFTILSDPSNSLWEVRIKMTSDGGELFYSVFPSFVPSSEKIAPAFESFSGVIDNQIKKMALHSESLKAQVGLLGLVYHSFLQNNLTYQDLGKMFETSKEAVDLAEGLIVTDADFEYLVDIYNSILIGYE